MTPVDQVDEVSDSGWVAEMPKKKYFFESEQNMPVITYIKGGINPKENREFTSKDQNERIKEVSRNGPFAEYTIDNQFTIRTPSPKFCEESIKAWQKYAAACRKNAPLFGAITLLSFTGAVVLATGGASGIATAFVISGLVSGFFWLLNHDFESKKEIAAWKNPYQNRIAEHRKKAYENGILYVVKKDLKLGGQTVSKQGSLLEEEVRFLYEEYFDEYCKNKLKEKPSSDESKTVWLKQVVKDNPLSKKMMKYGLGKIPDHFKGIVENYTPLVRILSGGRDFFNDQKIHVEAEAKAYIAKIHQKKEERLTPYKINRDNHYALAFEERYEKMQKAQTPAEKDQVQDEYKQTTTKYHNFYNQIVDEVRKPFDEKIKQVEEERNRTIAKIDAQPTVPALAQFEEVWTMMQMAQKLKSDPHFVYKCPITVLNQPIEPSFPGMDDIPENFDLKLRQAYANKSDFLALLDEKPAPYTPFVLRQDSEGYYLLPHFEKEGFMMFGTYRCKECRFQIGRDFLIDTSKKIAPKGWIFEDADNRNTTASSNPQPLVAGM